MSKENVMQPLTKEQQEYMQMKQAKELMIEKLQECKSTCHPRPEYMGTHTSVMEQYFYLCLEILEGKHRDFLNRLHTVEEVDKTNSK